MAAGDEEFIRWSLVESIRVKGMWAGALSRVTIPGLAGVVPTPPRAVGEAEDEAAPPPWTLAEIRREHTPGLLKIFDEVIVNASDHYKGCAGDYPTARSKHVTRIAVSFDPKTGRFSCENDGPGFPVKLHEKVSAEEKRDVYTPEVACAMPLAGTNMNKRKGSVKGGINGLGLKIANIHSAVFLVETIDGDRRLSYTQLFQDRLRTRNPPKVEKTTEKPRTRITYVPVYAELGYELEGGKTLAAEDAADLLAWLRWRLFQTAAYVGPKVAVTFNGELCPTTTARALAEIAAPGAEYYTCTARAKDGASAPHPWDIAVAVVPGQKKFAHVSIVNGVACAKGPHLAYFKGLFADAAEKKLRAAAKDKNKTAGVREVCGGLTAVFVGPMPDADWTGQRKDELSVSRAQLSPLTIVAASLGKLGEAIAAGLLVTGEAGGKRRKPLGRINKYRPARLVGWRNGWQGKNSSLLVTEGDSALVLMTIGMALAKTVPGAPSPDLYGSYTLGGVIMNVLPQITVVKGPGGEIIVRSEKLRKNEVLNNLALILGLEFGQHYATPAERARSLNYGRGIIACVDQDLDGTGKILGLLLVFFRVFWPELIEAGLVRRLLTPVVRVYPRPRKETAAPVAEFFSEDDFRRWAEARGGEEAVGRAYEPKYYKGLASHDEREARYIFERFDSLLQVYTIEDADRALLEVYYGPDAEPRKQVLRSPVEPLGAEEARRIAETRRLPLRVHLEQDTKAYKLEAIERNIPCILDGMTRARRKVATGALRCFASNNKAMKVFQFGGYVALHVQYHHGDASLNGTITRMAQRFPGAYRFPYLQGVGMFGSRHMGGKDAGSARYISVRLSAAFARAVLAAPRGRGGEAADKASDEDDRYLLPHEYESGERAEPSYFVPVLPMAALESGESPAEGWRYKCVARDFDQVVALVRAYVAGDARVHTAVEEMLETGGSRPAFRAAFPLEPSRWGYGDHLPPAAQKELIRARNGELTSFGYYVPEFLPDGATVLRVTELPLGRATQPFLDKLDKPGTGTKAKDREAFFDFGREDGLVVANTPGRVDVRIRLRPGAWEAINERYGDAEVDPIEDFLGLHESLRPFLNFCGERGNVIELGDDYHALILYWLPYRRDLYRRRLERRAALLRLRIRLEAETVRFIGLATEIDLPATCDKDAAARALESRGFARYDAALLSRPGFTTAEKLEERVTQGDGASYAYLLDLKQSKLLEAARRKRVARLEGLRREAEEVAAQLTEKPFAGASAWTREIDAVVAAVAENEKGDGRVL